MKKGFFITGTGTGVGKTIVSAVLVKKLAATYWKPLQTGYPEDDDTTTVQHLTDAPIIAPLYRLQAPLSPHQAAEKENISIQISQLKNSIKVLPENCIVEGAGGILVPITETYSMRDFAADLQLPIIIVCIGTLGTLNHTFLTIEALRAKNLPIAGVIINGTATAENKRDIKDIGKIEILGQIPQYDRCTPANIAAALQLSFC